MERCVAFLRGMNLGGRRIKNEELRAEFEALGFEDVATFRASGNVVFSSRKGSESSLRKTIEAGLGDALGYEVPVFLRAAPRWRRSRPRSRSTAKLIRASKGKLQVTFLVRKPSPAARRKVEGFATRADRLAISGRELYWLPSGGISESELDLKAIDTVLGGGTMRTMGTVEQIAARHCSD